MMPKAEKTRMADRYRRLASTALFEDARVLRSYNESDSQMEVIHDAMWKLIDELERDTEE